MINSMDSDDAELLIKPSMLRRQSLRIEGKVLNVIASHIADGFTY